jgi:hypothetical protein
VNGGEWAKILVPVVLLAVIALLWQLIRPGITKLLFYFLDSEEGRGFFEPYCEKVMNGRFVESSTAASAAKTAVHNIERLEREMADRFTKVDFTQNAHGVELSKIAHQLADMPSLKDSVDRLTVSVDKFAQGVDTLAKWKERVEGREEERDRNRRSGDPR